MGVTVQPAASASLRATSTFFFRCRALIALTRYNRWPRRGSRQPLRCRGRGTSEVGPAQPFGSVTRTSFSAGVPLTTAPPPIAPMFGVSGWPAPRLTRRPAARLERPPSLLQPPRSPSPAPTPCPDPAGDGGKTAPRRRVDDGGDRMRAAIAYPPSLSAERDASDRTSGCGVPFQDPG